MALVDSLVAYWKLDEASGTRADATGRGNDLTDNNTVTQAAGKVGNAAQFTAANLESLSKADNADLSTGDVDFTVSAWVYFDSLSTARHIVSKDSGGTQREFLLYVTALGLAVFAVSNNGLSSGIDTVNSGATVLVINTWYHLIAWNDSAADTINLQINNGSVFSLAHSGGGFDTPQAFRIGGNSGFGEYQDGRIDEVGFWKRVLTTDERAVLYNNGNGRAYPLDYYPGTRDVRRAKAREDILSEG